jgi:hypothetical protein
VPEKRVISRNGGKGVAPCSTRKQLSSRMTVTEGGPYFENRSGFMFGYLPEFAFKDSAPM